MSLRINLRQYTHCAKCLKKKDLARGCFVCGDCARKPGLYNGCAVGGEEWGEPSRCYVCEDHSAHNARKAVAA